MKQYFEKAKGYIYDFVYTIGSTFVVAVVTQLVLYPAMASEMSAERYGIMLSAIGVWEILVAATGKELCNTRLVCERNDNFTGEPAIYVKVMGFSCLMSAVAIAIYMEFALHAEIIDVGLMSVLSIVSTAKAYLFVRFRINSDFKRLFVSNCLMSFGYVAGILAFGLNEFWPAVFILAEVLALVYTLRVTRFKIDKSFSPKTGDVFSTYANLAMGSVVGGLGSSFDRVSIPFILGAEALSTFFAASFFGKIIFFISAPLRTVIVTYTGNGRLVFTRKTVVAINIACIGVVALFSVVSWLFGDWITALLYPSLYAEASQYVLAANVAVILYLVFSVNMSLLLGNAPAWLQPVFSVLRIALYVILAFGFALEMGLKGYVAGIAIANAVMGAASFAACVRWAKRKDSQ